MYFYVTIYKFYIIFVDIKIVHSYIRIFRVKVLPANKQTYYTLASKRDNATTRTQKSQRRKKGYLPMTLSKKNSGSVGLYLLLADDIQPRAWEQLRRYLSA